MESETFPMFLDNKLLRLKQQQNTLFQNYSIFKNTKTNTKCKVANDRKCQIINTSEVSRVLNNYLEKMLMADQLIKDEKISRVCQEIEKLHNASQNEQNRDVPVSSCISTNNVGFEKDIFEKNKKMNTSCSTENASEIPKNIPKLVVNEVVNCADDFLTIQNENFQERNERGNTGIQDDEKLQSYGITQDNLILLNRTTEKPSNWLEKEDRQAYETKSLSDSNEKAARNSEILVERPYACSKCRMTFKRNLHLKRHFTVAHTSNKNFKCSSCGKMFSRKDYLDKHKGGHQKKNLKIKLLEQGIVVRTKIFSKSEK